jgi:hypothetical protein
VDVKVKMHEAMNIPAKTEVKRRNPQKQGRKHDWSRSRMVFTN